MKIITFYTDTHKILFDRFVDTLKQTNPGMELIQFKAHQRSKSGDYSSIGFNPTMVDKITCILSAMWRMEENEYFVYADCDIQFFGDIEEDLKKHIDADHSDMIFQDDVTRYCAGFFLCKKTEMVKRFFHEIKQATPNYLDDQEAINVYIKKGFESLKFSKLNSDKYFTVAATNGGKRWSGKPFLVPKNIIIHHANWVVGVKDKIRLLDYVQNLVNIQ